jgi:hypothetical protein
MRTPIPQAGYRIHGVGKIRADLKLYLIIIHKFIIFDTTPCIETGFYTSNF